MTEGMTSTSDVERNKAPSESSCTTSALSPRTRHTARRRPTVVSGSYVTLSSNTRRTLPPAWVCCAKDSLTGWPRPALTHSSPSHRTASRAALSGAHQRLAVFAHGADLTVPPGHRLPQGPGRADHDLRAVL